MLGQYEVVKKKEVITTIDSKNDKEEGERTVQMVSLKSKSGDVLIIKSIGNCSDVSVGDVLEFVELTKQAKL